MKRIKSFAAALFGFSSLMFLLKKGTKMSLSKWLAKKHYFRNIQTLKLALVLFFSVCVMFVGFSVDAAEKISFQKKRGNFEDKIPDIAKRYIGIPYGFGKGFEKSGAVDNSHLFYLIYDKAAREAGLKFVEYMPMKDLLGNTAEVQRNELKKGDLIVLNDDHAAMIYRIENRDKFYMIYTSLKRQQVISFNSQNVIFEVYWLENLKCFRRLTDDMFLPDD